MANLPTNKPTHNKQGSNDFLLCGQCSAALGKHISVSKNVYRNLHIHLIKYWLRKSLYPEIDF